MPEDTIDDLDELDGSTLRRKLEKALSENRKLSEENTTFKAKDVISSGNFNLVKPEDLAGVSHDKVKEHAEQLQSQRLDERRGLTRDILQRQGYEDSELDEAVELLMAGEGTVAAPSAPDPADAFERVRALDRQAAAPVSAQNTEKLHGVSAIEHGLAQNSKKPRRF